MEESNMLGEVFWAIVFKLVGEFEKVERYDDCDDVRADFEYMIQQNPQQYEYVILQQVSIVDGLECIDIIEEFNLDNIKEA